MKYHNPLYSLEELKNILGAHLLGEDSSLIFDAITTDSRDYSITPTTLFVALKGKKDGHDYIPELLKRGVKAFLVSSIPSEEVMGANFILVEDTLKALQLFAKYHRSRFNAQVVAIGGSNGKTVVKEWLNEFLESKYKVARSPKSYNSQIGVPLSLLQIGQEHEMVLIEAGISKKGEMRALEDMIAPDWGILTHIGSAHGENFDSTEQKLGEKLQLYRNCSKLVSGVSENFQPQVRAYCASKDIVLLTWGAHLNNDLLVMERSEKNQGTRLRLRYKNDDELVVELPFTDTASVDNFLTVCLSAKSLGYSNSQIKNNVQNLQQIEMRLEILDGYNQCTLINDTYNSDLQSVKVALNMLHRQDRNKEVSVIISEILQSGFQEETMYGALAEALGAHVYKHLIVVGEKAEWYGDKFPANTRFYRSLSELMEQIDRIHFSNETILIKGARPFRFERLTSLLAKKAHDTVFEVDLNQLVSNLNFYRSQLKGATKIMCMVKALAYGAGASEIANVLQFHGVDYLGVAYADEGVRLRRAGISMPIMVMNPEQSSYRNLIEYNLEPEIYSFRVLDNFVTELKKYPEKQPFAVHLKIDTGMHRLGFSVEESEKLGSRLNAIPEIAVASIFSHLVSSDDLSDSVFTHKQASRLNDAIKNITRNLGYKPLCHLLNSAGIANYPEFQMDMVRLGLGLYGISPKAQFQDYLKPIGQLWSVISQVKELKPGESVGYNRRFIAKQPTRIATIPVGYADGIRRAWGNGVGYVSIEGHRAPIVGSICMDMLMVDVSEIMCNEGDRVCIMGTDPDVNKLADAIGTIPYEILTSISDRVKRIYLQE